MLTLQRVLWFKIIVTLIAWALPFLFLPKELFESLLGYSPSPLFTIRLLGWAYVALVIGYAYGLQKTNKGIIPWGVICMGLVSNGGAAAILGWYLLFGEASKLNGLPQVLFWTSFVALSSITLGLGYSARQLSNKP